MAAYLDSSHASGGVVVAHSPNTTYLISTPSLATDIAHRNYRIRRTYQRTGGNVAGADFLLLALLHRAGSL